MSRIRKREGRGNSESYKKEREGRGNSESYKKERGEGKQ